MQKLEKIFTGEDREMLDKLDYFKNKKALEGNPLVRFCPQPDCDGHMIGRNMNERKKHIKEKTKNKRKQG